VICLTIQGQGQFKYQCQGHINVKVDINVNDVPVISLPSRVPTLASGVRIRLWRERSKCLNAAKRSDKKACGGKEVKTLYCAADQIVN